MKKKKQIAYNGKKSDLIGVIFHLMSPNSDTFTHIHTNYAKALDYNKTV